MKIWGDVHISTSKVEQNQLRTKYRSIKSFLTWLVTCFVFLSLLPFTYLVFSVEIMHSGALGGSYTYYLFSTPVGLCLFSKPLSWKSFNQKYLYWWPGTSWFKKSDEDTSSQPLSLENTTSQMLATDARHSLKKQSNNCTLHYLSERLFGDFNTYWW